MFNSSTFTVTKIVKPSFNAKDLRGQHSTKSVKPGFEASY